MHRWAWQAPLPPPEIERVASIIIYLFERGAVRPRDMVSLSDLSDACITAAGGPVPIGTRAELIGLGRHRRRLGRRRADGARGGLVGASVQCSALGANGQHGVLFGGSTAPVTQSIMFSDRLPAWPPITIITIPFSNARTSAQARCRQPRGPGGPGRRGVGRGRADGV